MTDIDAVRAKQIEALGDLPHEILDHALKRLAVIQNVPEEQIPDAQVMALLGDMVAVTALAFIAGDLDNRTYGEAVRRIMAQADVTWSDIVIAVQEAK